MKRMRWALALVLVAVLGLGVAGALAAPLEAYDGQWSEPLAQGDRLLLDVFSVSVVVESHEGSDLSAVFEGKRQAATNGELPELVLARQDQQVSLSVVWPKSSLLNFSQGRLEGTLTIRVPQVLLESVEIVTFVGAVAVRDVQAEHMALSTSSGKVTAEAIALAGGDMNISTFSGSQTLRDIGAREMNLDASSGRIEAEGLVLEGALMTNTFSGEQRLTGVRAASVQMDGSSGGLHLADAMVGGDVSLATFSGKQSVEGLTASGTVDITASSGAVSLAEVRADALSVDTFSGRVEASALTVAGHARLATSSGGITVDGITAQALETSSFSGAMQLAGMDAQLVADNSSGRVEAAFVSGADATVSTFSGDVTLTYPQGTGLDYLLETFSGRMTLEADGEAAPEKEDGMYAGTAGDGVFAVLVDTSSGDLRLILR